jgi:hypothetical protein
MDKYDEELLKLVANDEEKKKIALEIIINFLSQPQSS